jgi:hypothetical protein
MYKRILILIVLSLSLFNCSSISNSLLNEKDKKAELEKILPKVVQIYLWKSYGDLGKYLKDSDDDELLRSISKNYQDIKISDVLKDQINYENQATRAFVVLEVKSFSAPNYVLQSHFDQMEWKFDNSTGWKLIKVDFGKASISNASS